MYGSETIGPTRSRVESPDTVGRVRSSAEANCELRDASSRTAPPWTGPEMTAGRAWVPCERRQVAPSDSSASNRLGDRTLGKSSPSVKADLPVRTRGQGSD